MPLTFVTGPARSGKSSFAVRLASESGLAVTYVATATRDDADPEWSERIARHAASRPPGWRLAESAGWNEMELLAFVRACSASDCVLVDSLGTWLAARLHVYADLVERDYRSAQLCVVTESERLCDAFAASAAQVIVVSEQTGWGIVPAFASARLFRDVLGAAEQRLARTAERAYVVIAGFALDLRAAGVPVELPRP